MRTTITAYFSLGLASKGAIPYSEKVCFGLFQNNLHILASLIAVRLKRFDYVKT